MIKRLLFAIISCLCFVMPVSANISIDADTVDAVVTAKFGNNRAAALKEYNSAVAKNTDKTISAKDLWGVCAAGGLNIEQPDGKQNCTDFVYMLVKASNIQYYEVCKPSHNAPGEAECVKNVFDNIRVNTTPAVAIAQEYARVKYTDNIKCSKDFRTEDGDDYLKCASIDINKSYEFRFDTLEAWLDDNVKLGIQTAMCTIHDSYWGNLIYDNGTARVFSSYGCVDVDESKCNDIKQTAAKFGYSGNYNAPAKVCEIDMTDIKDPADLKNDFRAEGVDNFYFCSNAIQVMNNIGFLDAIKEYLSFEVGVSESQVQCASGFKTYRGDGCRVGWINQKDDVVRCSVGDREIDFVFDDINEKNKTRAAGGMEGVICLANDGTFDGKSCMALNEQQCNVLKEKMKTACTSNCDKEISWDDTNKVCVMPNATTATQRQKIAKYALDAGIVVGAVALTVFTGGAASGVWVVVAKVGTIAVLTGAAAKETAQTVMTWRIYEPFKKRATACLADESDVGCAEQILKDDLQELLSYGDHFLQEEAHALDGIFARLIERIPKDSQFWQDFINDEELWDCTDTGCHFKTKHQTWEYVSQIGDAFMLAGGLARAVASIGSYVQTTKALKDTGEKIIIESGFKGKGGTSGYRVASYNGEHLGNTWLSNDYLDNLGLVGQGHLTNSQIAAKLAAEMAKKSIDITKPISVNMAKELLGIPVTGATSAVSTGLSATALALNATPAVGALIAVVPGHGGDEGDFYVVLVDEEPVAPKDNRGTGTGTGTGTGDGNKPPVEPELPVQPVDNVELVSNVNNNNSSVLPGIEYQSGSRPTTFVPKKTKNVGLIAAAAVLGTVGTGALIGGLVVSNNKKTSGTTATPIQTDAQLDTVMANARGTLGFMGNKPVTLVSLPTVMNKATAPIVLVDGRAVVVVSYDGHKLPFYLDENKWEPLLGIGPKGHWFNVYPEKIGISKIEKLANLLNDKLLPVVVAKYVTQNVSGVSFPTADKSAFEIINSEFPNGVVESVYMSNADKQLYNDNYLLVRQSLL